MDVRISSRWHAEWDAQEEMLLVGVRRVRQCEVLRLRLCWPGRKVYEDLPCEIARS